MLQNLPKAKLLYLAMFGFQQRSAIHPLKQTWYQYKRFNFTSLLAQFRLASSRYLACYICCPAATDLHIHEHVRVRACAIGTRGRLRGISRTRRETLSLSGIGASAGVGWGGESRWMSGGHSSRADGHFCRWPGTSEHAVHSVETDRLNLFSRRTEADGRSEQVSGAAAWLLPGGAALYEICHSH